MSTQTTRTEMDWISRLGCMRRNTIVEDSRWGQVEHIEVWVPEKLQVTTMQNKESSDQAVASQRLKS